MQKVILYTHKLNPIGGIETFCYNFCKRLSPYIDITFLYTEADMKQLLRISDHVNTVKYTGQHLTCDTLIMASAWGKNPENVQADKVIQMIHADYGAYIKNWNFTYTPWHKTTHHLAVGQHVKNSFEKTQNKTVDYLVYNILDNFSPKERVKSNHLRLITLSRISKEKGFPRMVKLCEMLEDAEIPFTWHVFGDTSTPYAKRIIPEFRRYPVKFECVTGTGQHILHNYDYLVQLSDTEGMPYCILEALQSLTPVITTDYPSSKELIHDGVNGYILPMDMNFDIDKLLKIPKLHSFTELGTENDWIKIL